MPDSRAGLLMRAVLPNGGYVVTWHVFFDETGTDEDSPFICVAGYIFDEAQFVSLDAKWAAMLAQHKDANGKPLEYFRMSSCNANAGPFAKFTATQCDLIAREAIALIREHHSHGFAVSFDKRFEYLLRVASVGHYDGRLKESAYSTTCWSALTEVRRFLTEKESNDKVAYFFEQGHANQGEARFIFDALFSKRGLEGGDYQAVGSGFYDKTEVRPLQCADILAWHCNKQVMRSLQGNRKLRGDFAALLSGQEHMYRFHVHDERSIKQIALRILKDAMRTKWQDLMFGRDWV